RRMPAGGRCMCWCRSCRPTCSVSIWRPGASTATGPPISERRRAFASMRGASMRFDLITLFPDMFAALRDQGVTGRAHARGLWSLGVWNPRDFTEDVHRTVDDRPYGGGPGMVMMAEPLARAVAAARAARHAES